MVRLDVEDPVVGLGRARLVGQPVVDHLVGTQGAHEDEAGFCRRRGRSIP